MSMLVPDFFIPLFVWFAFFFDKDIPPFDFLAAVLLLLLACSLLLLLFSMLAVDIDERERDPRLLLVLTQSIRGCDAKGE